MQQHLIHQQAQQGDCGIQAAAPPPLSNHNSGLAIDIEDPGAWRPYLERHGWQWLGAWDPMHFDYTKGGVDLGGAQVLAFQQLWSKHNPEAPLVEDGIWGRPPQPPLSAHRQPGSRQGMSTGFGPKGYWDSALPQRVCVWGAGQRFPQAARSWARRRPGPLPR